MIFFVAMYVNLIVADRLAPLARSAGPEDEIVERYRNVVEPYAGRIRFAVAAFFAVVMASGVASEWRDWILFSHATKFGIKDPQFHRDIGFYVFKLPFLEFIAGWTFAALLVILIVTLVFHYLNGGIRLQTPFQRVTPQVKVHISVILALMALTKTVQYYLARFGLTLSHRGVVDGATYTDVKAQLPALNLLMLISVAAAILFIANIFRKGWVFPIIAVGLWGFISIVVGTIYPAVIQRFVVQPNEYAREQTYIEPQHRRDTRAAFGLDKIDDEAVRVQHRPHGRRTVAQPENQQTLDNARLWDPAPLGQRARRDRGVPALLFVLRRRRRPLRRQRPGDADAQRRARARRVAAAEQHVDEPSPRVHARLRHRHRARQRAQRRPADVSCSPTSRAAGARCRSRSPTCTSARASPAIRSSTARSPSKRPTARARANDHAVPRRRRREGEEPRAPARVRIALRRLQPRVLGPGHDVSRASSTSVTSRSACRPRRRSCSGTPIRTP